ncbi:MAG TPA: hypothetical protein VEB22_07310 [Phycisphaerales bacterium]|nr:hypothetical protein [Phycisphaerales bacterium]
MWRVNTVSSTIVDEFIGYPYGWSIERDYLLCAFVGTGGINQSWRVVLWPIPLLLWPPAALLLRSGITARRRTLKGMCAKCGYSLAGLGDGAACPECGKPSSTLSTQDSPLKTSS